MNIDPRIPYNTGKDYGKFTDMGDIACTKREAP